MMMVVLVLVLVRMLALSCAMMPSMPPSLHPSIPLRFGTYVVNDRSRVGSGQVRSGRCAISKWLIAPSMRLLLPPTRTLLCFRQPTHAPNADGRIHVLSPSMSHATSEKRFGRKCVGNALTYIHTNK
ncbi:hypothetical protein JOL62DRAFT_4792 [Phyllosticta paracitricarpa]|uniref:Secreted protein n=2 Tax=Phyllosticta TaxID=121621 RepID=A0ABR1LLY2_9PEZI